MEGLRRDILANVDEILDWFVTFQRALTVAARAAVVGRTQGFSYRTKDEIRSVVNTNIYSIMERKGSIKYFFYLLSQ